LIRIKSAFVYVIEDNTSNNDDKEQIKKQSPKQITIEIQPDKDASIKGEFFYHLLP